MKKLILTFVLVIISGYVYSQPDLQKVKKRHKGKSGVEIYYVLKHDKNIKSGGYQLLINGGKAVSGQYIDNKKAGIWTYYDFDGSVNLKYDFDKDSVLYFHDKNEIWNQDKLDRPLIYFGSLYEAKNIVMNNLIYPEDAQENGKSGTILVDIYVNKYGHVYDYKVLNRVYPSLDEEALTVVKMIPQKWLPAIKSGKPIDYEYTFPVVFVVQ